MACLDCDDCRKVKQVLTYCGDGVGNNPYTLGQIVDENTVPVPFPWNVLIRITKQNGSVFEIFTETYAAGGKDGFVFLSPNQYPRLEYLNGSSGLVKVEVLNMLGGLDAAPPILTPLLLEDTYGEQARCLLLEFANVKYNIDQTAPFLAYL